MVNDQIITDYDVDQRMLLYIATSGLPPTPDVKKRLHDQILKQLETEQLQIQEARRKNITISPADVDKSIDRITTDNHLTREQLETTLAKNGVQIATLRAQIAVQIAWQKAVEDEFQDRINITPADTSTPNSRASAKAQPRRISSPRRFSFPSTIPDLDPKALKDAQDLIAQLQSGASFQNMARQFSQSPTAASGGDLAGSIRASCRPRSTMRCRRWKWARSRRPSAPMAAITSWACATASSARARTFPIPPRSSRRGPLRVARLLLPIGPKPAKPLLDNVLKLAAQIHDHINGCDTLDDLQKKVRGLVVQDITKMGLKISDLSPEIQAAINKRGPANRRRPSSRPPASR